MSPSEAKSLHASKRSSRRSSPRESRESGVRPSRLQPTEGKLIRSGDSPLSSLLLQICDASIAAMLFVAPLFMGGRHPLGELVVVTLASVLAAFWLLRQAILPERRWRMTGVELWLAADLTIILLQLIPLPREWLLRLSPAIADYLPLWFSDDASRLNLGTWQRLTLTPEATQAGLVMFLAYGLFFCVLTQRIEQVRDAERLLNWLGVSAVTVAAVGLLQVAFGSTKFLGIYEHPERIAAFPVRGPFINENHFAHLLALGMGPLLVWFVRVGDETAKPAGPSTMFGGPSPSRQFVWQRFLIALAIGVVGNAALLSFSRGGVVVVSLASVVTLLLLMRANLLSKKIALGLSVTGMVLFASLMIFGWEALTKEMSTLNSLSFSEIDSGRIRKQLWDADREAARSFPLLGTGVGSHREVYPIFLSHFYDVEFTHAESGFIQIMLETGWCGLALLATALSFVGYWLYRLTVAKAKRSFGYGRAAIASGVAASLIHSAWDFIWYIPACMCALIVLLACACRLAQLSRDESSSTLVTFSPPGILLSRSTWGMASLVTIAIAWLSIVDRFPAVRAAEHWDAYFKYSAVPEHLANPSPQDLLTLLRHLEKIVSHHPRMGRAHARAARHCLTMFNQQQAKAENPLELVFIRDAALSSNFANLSAQDEWLNRVIGNNRRWLDLAWYHAREAVRLCPLQGEAYLYLAQLSFLHGLGDEIKQPLLDQALLVRPYHGEVLITAGAEAGLAGAPERQLQYWKRAFQQNTEVQRQLIQLLAQNQPVEFFTVALAAPPAALEPLYQFYHSAKRPQDASVVGKALISYHVARAAETTGAIAANHWQHASAIHQQLQHPEEAEQCLRKAIAMLPEDWGQRWALIQLLRQAQRWDDAIEELKWCLRRRPDDTAARDLLAESIRQQFQAKKPSQPL